jgi:polyisoprenyl-teichoic acid--peptidoglycan teichoic acid transferase
VAATVSPSQVLVEVLNGFGGNGAATAAAAALHGQGFAINGTGNASSFEYADNVIEYAPGQLSGAYTLEGYVTGTTQIVESDQVPPGEVQLVLGSSYDGIADD